MPFSPDPFPVLLRLILSTRGDLPVVAAPLGQAGAGEGLGPAGNRPGEGSALAGEPDLRVVLSNGALLGVPGPPPRLRPNRAVVLLRPIPPRCESGRVFTLPRASQPNPNHLSPAPCELAGLVGSQRLEQRTSRPVICDHSFQPQSDARRTAIGIVTVLPATGGADPDGLCRD